MGHWLAAEISRFHSTKKEQNLTGRCNSKSGTLVRKYWGLCLFVTESVKDTVCFNTKYIFSSCGISAQPP